MIANVSFSNALREPSRSFWPVESESERSRLLLEPEANTAVTIEDLEWVRKYWFDAGRLMHESREFNLAFQAFDQSSFARSAVLALLLLWGGFEALFSAGRSELRFRVSANIATFLEAPGKGRAVLQRGVAKLYDARSAAAHGRPDQADDPLIKTYALFKRALLKIIAENRVPSVDEIESALFGAAEISS